MKRKNGYYWVRYNGEWIVGEFYSGHWGLTFFSRWLYDKDFTKIDERKIVRQ